jgi:hypothetical protein
MTASNTPSDIHQRHGAAGKPLPARDNQNVALHPDEAATEPSSATDHGSDALQRQAEAAQQQ